MKKIGFLLCFSSLLFLVGCQSWNEDEKEKETQNLNWDANSLLEGAGVYETGEEQTKENLSFEEEISEYLSHNYPSDKNAQQYWQNIYQLVKSGENLEIKNEIPLSQNARGEYLSHGMDIQFMDDPDYFLQAEPAYQIGKYTIILCGVGGGAFSPYGNLCYTPRTSLSTTIQDTPIEWRSEFFGVLISKIDDYRWTNGMSIDAYYSNSPKGLIIKDGKLLLVTLDGNGAGSGEGMISVYILLEDGTRELADCRYYLWDCTEEEQKADPNCILSPLNLERFEQYPLIACSDYDARDGEMEI